MSSISLFLRTVNDSVNVFKMNNPYSEPKIFTGGVNISDWKELSLKERKQALSKDWFVYYSYRDPKTGKLKRQSHIKAGANRYKDKRSRLSILKTLQRNLSLLLESGFNPYEDNSANKERFLGKISKNTKPTVSKPKEEKLVTKQVETDEKTIKEAFEFGLGIKKLELNSNSYNGYSSHINKFKKWLLEKELGEAKISIITKTMVIEYLNTILQVSSPRNRNNNRASISSLFTTLEDNEIINENFIKKIKNLKSTPKRNKTYTPEMQKKIYEYMEYNDPLLLLFVQFVSYNFLRPIEVCRLKVGDIDFKDKKLYVKAKNKGVKIKIIPDHLLKEIPDLSSLDKNFYWFQIRV